MTTTCPVTIDAAHFVDEEDQVGPSRGTLVFTPYSPVITDEQLITEQPIVIRYTGEPTTVNLAVLPAGNGWTSRLELDGEVYERLVAPVSADPVNLVDLPDLDPSTMQPLPDATPAWLPPISDLAEAVAVKADQTALDAEVTNRDVAITGAVAGLAPVARSGSASDITGGTLPTSVIPALSIIDTTPVASQAAMLALTAQKGDVAVRTDTGKTYILSSNSPTTLADWIEMPAAGKVASVNGQQGVIVLAKGDVGLSLADNVADINKPVSTPQATLIATKKDDPYRFDATRLRAFKAALAKRASTPLDILATPGASWIAGSGAGTPPVGRFIYDIQAAMRAKWQPAGVAGGLGYRESYSFTSGWVTPFTYTGTTLAQTSIGLGRKVIRLTLNSTVSFISPGTSVDVFYGKSTTAGTFAWKLNAGSETTVNANATSISDGVLRIVTTPGDTVTLRASQAGGFLYFSGVFFYDGDETKGIHMWGGGTSGYRTTDFIDGAGVTYGMWSLIDPDLIITGDVLANNYGGGTANTPVSVSTTFTELGTLLAAERARCTRPPSVILMLMPEITTVNTTLAPWSAYRQGAIDFAKADGAITLWDVAAVFNSMLTDPYGIGAGDLAHPSLSGHQAVCDDFMNLLAAA